MRAYLTHHAHGIHGRLTLYTRSNGGVFPGQGGRCGYRGKRACAPSWTNTHALGADKQKKPDRSRAIRTDRPHGGKGGLSVNVARVGSIPERRKPGTKNGTGARKKSPAGAGRECVVVSQGKDDSGIVTQCCPSTTFVPRESQHASRECKKTVEPSSRTRATCRLFERGSGTEQALTWRRGRDSHPDRKAP